MADDNRTRIRKDYNFVFSTEEGKRVLADLYKFCGIDSQIYSENPHTTSFNAGKHRVAQHIQGLLSQNAQVIMDLAKNSDIIKIKSNLGEKV